MSVDTKEVLISILALILICVVYRCVAVDAAKDCRSKGGFYVYGTQGFGCITPQEKK